MDKPDFEALKSLPDEELVRALDILVKKHLRKFQTLFEEGDLGYARFAYERLMRDHAAFEELLLERLERIAKRENFGHLFPGSIQTQGRALGGAPRTPFTGSNTARTLRGGSKIQRACRCGEEYSAYAPRSQMLLPGSTGRAGARSIQGACSSKNQLRTGR